jgi:hypothetical protein
MARKTGGVNQGKPDIGHRKTSIERHPFTLGVVPINDIRYKILPSLIVLKTDKDEHHLLSQLFQLSGRSKQR